MNAKKIMSRCVNAGVKNEFVFMTPEDCSIMGIIEDNENITTTTKRTINIFQK